MRSRASAASNWRMRTYKSPVLAGAAVVVWVSQSSRQAATQLSVFLLLKLATLSFEIPPPISASVRSRQAGTETEREASAMEALGPGKEFRSKVAGRARRVCANASLHLGPRLQRGLHALTRKQTKAPSDFLCLWRFHADHKKRRTRFSPCASGFSVFIGPTRRPCGCIYPKPARLVVSRHCASGDLTRSFLPSFLPRRGVLTLMFVKDAFIFPHTSQNYSIPPTSVDVSEPCQNRFPEKRRNWTIAIRLGAFCWAAFGQDDSDGWEKETNANGAHGKDVESSCFRVFPGQMLERSGHQWRFDRWDLRPLISISWTITKTRSLRCDAANVDVHKGGGGGSSTPVRTTRPMHLCCHDMAKCTFKITNSNVCFCIIYNFGIFAKWLNTQKAKMFAWFRRSTQCQRWKCDILSTLMYYLGRTGFFFFLLLALFKCVRGSRNVWMRQDCNHPQVCEKESCTDIIISARIVLLSMITAVFNTPSLFSYCNNLFLFP